METAFNLGATLDVTARAPIPLTDTASGTLMNTGDSELYSVSVATAPALLRVLASSSATDAQPIAALLPGGKWSNAVNAALSIEQQSGTLDIVVFDGGTASGYNYSLKSKVEALASAAEAAGANDTIATALVAPSVPFVQTGGTLTGANEKDLIKIVLAAPAVVHVSAHSADDLDRHRGRHQELGWHHQRALTGRSAERCRLLPGIRPWLWRRRRQPDARGWHVLRRSQRGSEFFIRRTTTTRR